MALRYQKSLSHDSNFSVTFQHPLARRGLVEMLPTWWVYDLANPETGKTTDIYTGSPERVTLDELWESMKTNGMRDPFILAAGRYTRDCRLEAGNHRIKVFGDKNVAFVPATVIVNDDAVVSENNGHHKYHRELLLPHQKDDLRPYDERTYMQPSDVFKQIREMRRNGMLPFKA